MLSRSDYSENSYDIAQIIKSELISELNVQEVLKAVCAPDTCFKHPCAPRRKGLDGIFWEEAINQYFQVE